MGAREGAERFGVLLCLSSVIGLVFAYIVYTLPEFFMMTEQFPLVIMFLVFVPMIVAILVYLGMSGRNIQYSRLP